MTKHVFFDLDNTLTRSKSHIAVAHKPVLQKLISHADVIVVSGHDEGSIRDHLEDVSGYYILSQNGNHAEDQKGSLLWEQRLTDTQKKAIRTFVDTVEQQVRPTLPVTDPNDLYDDRGCEVAYSLIGHHEKIEKKEAFDPTGKWRQEILEMMSTTKEMQNLDNANVEVRIGGTTVLDFIEKGKNKGFNVRMLAERLGWKEEDCLYVGDALFPGGNDEAVVGVIPTKAVKDYNETFKFIQQELLV